MTAKQGSRSTNANARGAVQPRALVDSVDLAVFAFGCVPNSCLGLIASIVWNMVGDLVAAGDMFAHFIDDIVNNVIDPIDDAIDHVIDLVDHFAHFFLDTIEERHFENPSRPPEGRLT